MFYRRLTEAEAQAIVEEFTAYRHWRAYATYTFRLSRPPKRRHRNIFAPE